MAEPNFVHLGTTKTGVPVYVTNDQNEIGDPSDPETLWVAAAGSKYLPKGAQGVESEVGDVAKNVPDGTAKVKRIVFTREALDHLPDGEDWNTVTARIAALQ